MMVYKPGKNGLQVNTANGFKDVVEILKGREQPFYLYSLHDVKSRIRAYKAAFLRPIDLRFAFKANANRQLLAGMVSEGIGADVVSIGEVDRALEVGVNPEEIVFSGVGKSKDEISRAIALGVGQINVESLPELERVIAAAKNLKKVARVALRLNPDVSVSTHPYITTGMKENKFGMEFSQLPAAVALLRKAIGQVQFHGLAAHIGSQILDVAPMVLTAKWLRKVFEDLRSEGWALQSVDVGGGLGMDYQDASAGSDFVRLKEYGAQVSEALAGLESRILVEPGRFLVARSGVLLARVEYVKQTTYKTFVILNSGMNHLMRPSLYQAAHRIEAVKSNSREAVECDVVGPICESADVFAKNLKMPLPQEGDWFAIMDSGAYGYTMANSYNLRPLPEEVVV